MTPGALQSSRGADRRKIRFDDTPEGIPSPAVLLCQAPHRAHVIRQRLENASPTDCLID